MSRLQQQIAGLAILLSVAFVGVLLLVSTVFIAAYVVGVVAPIFGLLYVWTKGNLAWNLWNSHGRFQLPGNAVRIIGEGRARMLATIEALSGIGGFALSLVAPAFVFKLTSLQIPALGLGLALQIGTRIARRRVSEGAHPVDVLPPE